MNVSLTPELESYITEKVESGFYTSNSEVVREALRLLRHRDRIRTRKLRLAEGTGRPGRKRRVLTLEEVQARRDEILVIARRHGARNVRLFGSIVRGEAGPHSDVDFLVDMESGRSALDRAGLLVDLGELLGCGVDVATEGSLRERVRERALTEALTL
jgi:putative addiction module CopG family antidote